MASQAPRHQPTGETDPYDVAPWIRTGNRVLMGLAAGLVLFSLVSISGAVVASGVVNVENNYKNVQHLDGGIGGLGAEVDVGVPAPDADAYDARAVAQELQRASAVPHLDACVSDRGV